MKWIIPAILLAGLSPLGLAADKPADKKEEKT